MMYDRLIIFVVVTNLSRVVICQQFISKFTKILATVSGVQTGLKIYSPEPFPNLKVPESRICIRISDEENIFVPLDGCAGWLCWNSQLTLITKYKMHALYNDFRREVAGGAKSISNMNAMSWHLTLEQEAKKTVQNCDYNLFHKPKFRTYVPAMFADVWVEEALVYISLSSPTQTAVLEAMPALLRTNNFMDYDSKGVFRRTETIFFGCALAITDSNGGYLGCVYATQVLDDPKYGKPATECPSYTTPSNGLCVAEKMYPSLFPCDLESDICPRERSEDWQYTLPGTLYEIMFFVTREVGYVPALNTTTIVSDSGMAVSNSEVKMNAWDQILPIDMYHLGPIIPFQIQYSTEQWKRLDFNKLGPKMVVHVRDHSYITIPDRRTCPGGCCFWILISSIILATAVVVTYLIIFLRKKRKQPTT